MRENLSSFDELIVITPFSDSQTQKDLEQLTIWIWIWKVIGKLPEGISRRWRWKAELRKTMLDDIWRMPRLA